jgi:hypothetical protein
MTTAITYVHTRSRTTEHVYDVEVDGVIVAAANNYHAAELVALEVEARDTITVEGLELHAPESLIIRGDLIRDDGSVINPFDAPRCPCGDPAVFFVQYSQRVYAYCPECYSEQKSAPLLAQCAAVIRRCLGSTTGAGGIIEELRRVETALSKEGW